MDKSFLEPRMAAFEIIFPQAIQDLRNLFIEKSSDPRPVQILFSDNPAIQDLNYQSKIFASFYAYLF